MSLESQALYNQTNILTWKTSYLAYNIKETPEPPLQNYNYFFSKFFPSDKLLQQYITNKSSKYAWQINLSIDGAFIIILKTNNIEIRSSKSDFTEIFFQSQIYKDFYPQWRTISWSNSSNYFSVSFSNGIINIWDLQGSKLSLNTNIIKSNDFDIIIKVNIVEISKTKVKLYIFTLNGKIILYNINNFKVINHNQSNIDFISTPILCCESSNCNNMILFGTYNQINNISDNKAYLSGIIMCRLTDESPFIVPNIKKENLGSHRNSWYSFITDKKSSDGVILIRLSKNNKQIAALHLSNTVTVWDFPSLSPCFIWRNSNKLTNPSLTFDTIKHRRVFPRNYSDSCVAHICWWNSEYVVLTQRNGCVSLIGFAKSVQANNGNIILEPCSQIEESVDKSFFVLNCVSTLSKNSQLNIEKKQKIVEKSSWSLFRWLYDYLLTDNQSAIFADNRNNCSQSYTLLDYKLTTPEELFAIKIKTKQYSEALLLATQYNLDSDIVFQKQWRDSQKGIEEIKNILIKIKKRNWILNECLTQITDDITSMKFLLKLGFFLTDIEQLVNDSADNGELNVMKIEAVGLNLRNITVNRELMCKFEIEKLNLVQMEMIRIRKKLINFFDKLTVYEEIINISKVTYNLEMFSELKKLSSFEIAIQFARQNNIIGLEVLLKFYNNILSQHILTILSNIPESIQPSIYKTLFENLQPSLNIRNSLLENELDWCESEFFSEIYNEKSMLNEAENLYYQSNSNHSAFILPINGDSKSIVRDWCHWRVRKIEDETFNTSNALEILQIFKDLDIEMDKNLEFNLRFLYEGVYNCQVSNAFISLSDFEILSDFEKANMLMSRTSSERFLINFDHWIMPMIEEINLQSSERSLEFFRDYILHLGKKHLICTRKILEDKNCLEKVRKIIKFRDIIGLYLAILCDDNEVLNIDECANISKLASVLILKEQKDNNVEYIGELKQLQNIDNYISVLRILEKYELKKTIKFVHENRMNGELVENLITNMVFHYFKNVKNINKAIIKPVFTEIQISLSLVFKSVHPSLIYKNLLKSMLESGEERKIDLACEFMILSTKLTAVNDFEFEEKLIDFNESVECILVAVRNYINSSTSSKDGNILLAKYCLNFIKNPTNEIKIEWEIIKCSEFLDKWHCSLVPIEIRATENRFELLKKCLEKNKSLYKEMEEVIEAGTYFYEDKKTDKKYKEGEALRLIAQKAWNNNDRESLEIAMSSLLHRNHKPCWKECVMTLKVIDYPQEKKCKLGKYAITYCPDSVLPETVKVVNDIDLSTLTQMESQTKTGDFSSTNSNTNSNLISKPMKFLSSGLVDLSSKMNLKSLIDKSSDTLTKFTSQVSQMRSLGAATQEALYKSNNEILEEMNLDLIYRKNGTFALDGLYNMPVDDILKVLTLPSLIEDGAMKNTHDQMHFKMVQFNLGRDTTLAIIHAMLITEVNLVYGLRNDITANTYTRALIHFMICLNLLLKYKKPFPVLTSISINEIENILQSLISKMCDDELTVFNSSCQEFKDYLLLDEVNDNFSSVCFTKFFSSVDYRRNIIVQLSEFSDNEKLFNFSLLLAERYNIARYEVSWNYFISFVAFVSKENQFEEKYNFFSKVFDLKSFVDSSPLFAIDFEKRISSNLDERISEFKTVLRLLPEPCSILLFNKTPCEHKKWLSIFEEIFVGSVHCNYLDLCTLNKTKIIACLKLVVNSENVKLCSQLLNEFDLSEEFSKIKNEFSMVLANQTLWSNIIEQNSSKTNTELLERFEKALENFTRNDYDNCKDFISNTLFDKSETYITPDIKISFLKCANKYIDKIVNDPESLEIVTGNWSNVSLEVTIWLDHLENTVVKVVEKLREISDISEEVVKVAEYMSPDNYWHCLLTEMLLMGVSYQDLFTFTWDLSVDSVIIEDSILSHICHICSSKFLPLEGIVQKLSNIIEELDDYMDPENVQSVLERVLVQHTLNSKEQVHRFLLNEFIFRVRKNQSKHNLSINEHIFVILKDLGLPVNVKVTFQGNNIHIIDSLIQDCDSPEKMEIIPKVIELIELVEEDNTLWICWIKACIIKGVEYCSSIFDAFENLKNNKLYNKRIDKLAKDAVKSLSAFNSAEAISILILMDPKAAVDQVQLILLALKSDPTEYTNTMKNINIKALKIIVDEKLIPLYAKTIFYQRLVNFITREMDNPNIVQEVLEQLKENGLRDEATWLTSSSSHINPAMKTIEMVSGFWKRFSTGNNP